MRSISISCKAFMNDVIIVCCYNSEFNSCSPFFISFVFSLIMGPRLGYLHRFVGHYITLHLKFIILSGLETPEVDATIIILVIDLL